MESTSSNRNQNPNSKEPPITESPQKEYNLPRSLKLPSPLPYFRNKPTTSAAFLFRLCLLSNTFPFSPSNPSRYSFSSNSVSWQATLLSFGRWHFFISDSWLDSLDKLVVISPSLDAILFAWSCFWAARAW